MFNVFKNSDSHTPEPERKYGLYTISFFISGGFIAMLWWWLFAGSTIGQSYDTAREIFTGHKVVENVRTLDEMKILWNEEAAVAYPDQEGNKSKDELWDMVFKKYPSPEKPKFYTEQQLKGSKPRTPESMQDFQNRMKDWEHETGKSFLNDHWTMQKHKDEDNRQATKRFNIKPFDPMKAFANYRSSSLRDVDIHLGHINYVATITGKVTFETKYFATPSEMAQCSIIKEENARKKRKYSSEYCLNKYGMFITDAKRKNPQYLKECRSKAVPKYCGNGSTITGTSHANHDWAGSCKIYTDLSTDIGNNRKLINSTEEVICGEVWRDFATKIYNNIDPQKFITLNPWYSLIDFVKEASAAVEEDYEVAAQKQRDERINYYSKLQAETNPSIAENRSKRATFVKTAENDWLEENRRNSEFSENSIPKRLSSAPPAERIILAQGVLIIGFILFTTWLLIGSKIAILRKPSFLSEPHAILTVAVAMLGVFVWYYPKDAEIPWHEELTDMAYLFLLPLLFFLVPIYYMVIKEISKETKIYQETLIEGRGDETSRWAGFLTYIKRDITDWIDQSRNGIVRTKESPVFVGRTMWQYDYKIFGRDIGLVSEQHLITVGGSGAGKSRDLIFSNVLAYNGGMLIFDTKGEHVRMSYRRRKAYAPAYVIDPWNKNNINLSTAHWNPLDEIDVESSKAREQLLRLCEAIIMQEGSVERAVDVHFREIPQKILRGYMAHVMSKFPEGTRHLGSVYDLLVKGSLDGDNYDPEAVENVILDMMKNNACQGAPIEAAKLLSELQGTERSGVLSTLSRALDWVNNPNIREVITKPSTFSFRECKTKNATVYLIVPEDVLVQSARFMRTVYQSAFDVMDANNTPQPEGSNRRVVFLFDEFEVLGNFKPARDAALRKRSSHIKCWFVVQNYGQFQANYKNVQDFLGNSDKQFFGIDSSDVDVKKMVSDALGKYTVVGLNGREPESKWLMSESDVSKFLDAARNGMIVIPVQGLPMRLHRMPVGDVLGSHFNRA